MVEGQVKPTEQQEAEIRRIATCFSDVFHYRPTKGEVADAYWHLRWWCEQTNYNMGELFNSILPALAYYVLNFSVLHKAEDDYGMPEVAVILNAGTIPIKRTSGRTGRRPTHKMFETK